VPRSPFVVDIADLEVAGAARPERVVTPVEWILDYGRVAADRPIEAELLLRLVPGGLLVEGVLRIVAEMTCAACLEPYELELSVPIDATYEREPGEDAYALEGTQVDLEQLLRDEALTALPLVPRCEREHPRVVTSEGRGLNGGSSPDESPFAALREIIDRD